jgi:predicted ABC-type ATPase
VTDPGDSGGPARANDPILLLLAGPNGSGKSTLAVRRLVPVTRLPFINADLIAKDRWPGEEVHRAMDASQAAAHEREVLLAHRRSFITETVFSHRSKVELVRSARSLGYIVQMHVVLIPVDLCVARVAERVRDGGHDVPEERIRARYERLWPLVHEACVQADQARFYDNSSAASPLRPVAELERGRLIGTPDWPSWIPAVLLDF